MNPAKEEVMRLPELLPKHASLADIQYQSYVLQEVGHGLEDVEAGRTISEVELTSGWPSGSNGKVVRSLMPDHA